MKHITNENEKVNSEKLSIKKVGTIIGSGAICVALAGAISISGLFEKDNNAVKKSEKTENITVLAEKASQTEPAAEKAEIPSVTYTTLDTVVWRKASINEYEIAQTQKIKLTEGTKSSITTTAPKTEKTTVSTTAAQTKAAVKKSEAVTITAAESKKPAATTAKKFASKTMYANDSVNMRTSANTEAKILTTLSIGDKVTVTGKNGGWYRVTFNGMTGYIKAEFLQDNAPVQKKAPAQANNTPAASTGNPTINYTTEEFEMLCYVLQGEVGNCSDASKLAVANVIINRVKSPAFPNTISGVLTAGNQFTAISGYYNRSTVPTESTINCAKRAINGEDNSNGAIYYYAPRYCGGSTASWFETLTFCMELEGQRFFK